MRRFIKYPVSVAFVLLMGYSQIFTYVYLGVISTPTARIADGIERIHTPLASSSIFDYAIIEESEENKDDRDPLNFQTRAYDIASFFLPTSRAESFSCHTHLSNPCQSLAIAGDSYIRFRVFRL